MGRITAASVVLVLLPCVGWGQVPIGPEFLVSSFTTTRQTHPAVTMDGSAGFVVVWQTLFVGAPPPFERGVLARRFDPSGTPLDAAAFQVNTYTTDDQMYPDVAASAGGGFVVVWDNVGQDGSGQGIFGRRYDAAGVALSAEEFGVNTYTTSHQMYPAVAVHPGGFVAVWNSFQQVGSALDVFGRHYDSSGLPAAGEFPLSSDTSASHKHPDVAISPSGQFVVAYYRTNASTLSEDVFAQRFDATGTRVGGEILVNTFTTGYQWYPSVAMQPDGGFLVVWESFAQGGGDVMARRFDATGAPAGGEFRVNSYTTGGQGAWPQVAADPDGNFVVVWESAGQAGSGTHVFGQRLGPAGSPLGGEFRVGSSTWVQAMPSVAAAERGVFVVVWATTPNPGPSASDRILGQRFAPDLIFGSGFESGTLP